MNQQAKQTLKEIFEKHGLDPFDAFLLHESEWPEEARELMKQDREQMQRDAQRRGEARRAEADWADRRDRYEEPNVR